MIVRPLEERDVAQCAEILSSTPLWQRYGVTPESALRRFQEGLQSDALILVMVDEQSAGNAETVMGFAWVAVRGGFDRSPYLRLLAVRDSNRGAGLGHQLIQAMEDRLRQTGPDVFLLCADYNLAAQRFYEREGYLRVGQIPDYVISGVAEIVYYKRL